MKCIDLFAEAFVKFLIEFSQMSPDTCLKIEIKFLGLLGNSSTHSGLKV